MKEFEELKNEPHLIVIEKKGAKYVYSFDNILGIEYFESDYAIHLHFKYFAEHFRIKFNSKEEFESNFKEIINKFNRYKLQNIITY